MKKIIALALSAAISLSLLAGCGTPAAPEASKADTPAATKAEENAPAATDEAKPAENVTIKISTWDNSANPSIEMVIKAFEDKNPNIKVDLIDMPSADYTNKLSVMLNGGSELDAFWIKDADTTKSLFDKGQLADLTEYIARDGVDLSKYNGLADNFAFDGRTCGLPARTDYYVLYFNKGIFDAAGVAYPTNDMTWQQFEETAKKISSGDGPNRKYGALIHTWQACVQNWAVADGKNTIMAKDYSFFKPYYEMVLRMQNTDKSIMDFGELKTGNIHYSSPFLKGDIGMMPMGSWFMTTIISKKQAGESNIEWGVATIPHPEGIEAGFTVGAATPLVMNNASTKKEAAWEFIKFATSEEGALQYSLAGAIPGMANEQTLANIAKIEGMPTDLLDALAVKNIAFDRPMVDKVSEVNKMLEEEHGLIMLGENTVDEGLAAMAKRSAEIQG